MRIVKLLFSVLITFSLLSGNMASAAMACCADHGTVAKEETAMPCHKTSDKSSSQDASCKICKSCLNISVLPGRTAPATLAFSGVNYALPASHFTSFKPAGIESPPKHLS